MFKFLPLLALLASAVVADETSDKQQQSQDRSNQQFYLQQLAYPRFLPNLQRLDLSYEPNPNLVYVNPGPQSQDSSATTSSKTTKSSSQSAKIENLDSDVELIPEAQTQNPSPNQQGPQFPVIPQGGFSGLLPDQRFYIVGPQQQFYNQNPLYTQLPNNYGRAAPQLPGYQRFFVVPQGGEAGGAVNPNLQNQAGYQNALFFDPSVQNFAPSQPFFQQQQLIRNGDLNQSKPVLPDSQEDSRDAGNLSGLGGPGFRQFQYPSQPQFLLQQQQLNPQLLQAANLGLLSPTNQLQPQILQGAFDSPRNQVQGNVGPQYFPQQGQTPQDVNSVGLQDRNNQLQVPGGAYTPVFAGAPSAALPFFGVGRQLEIPLGQQQQQQYQYPQSPYSQLVQLGGGNGLPFPLLGLENQLRSQLGLNSSGKNADVSPASSNKNDTNASTESNSISDEENNTSKSSDENNSSSSTSQESTSTEKNS